METAACQSLHFDRKDTILPDSEDNLQDRFEYRQYLTLFIWDKITGLISLFVKCSTAFGFVFLFYLSIKSLAGQNTWADITVDLLSNIKFSQVAAWVFGCGGLIYGRVQHGLRKKNVTFFQGRIQTLETRIDPDRSSSNLTIDGGTRPEDNQ